MDSIYRSTAGREHIRRWCTDRLDAWPVPHERATMTVNGAQTHLMSAGSGPTTVVFVPGTNFNAAASLPLATALVAADHRLVLPDVPGQPGLSSGERGISGGNLSWYGTWLSEVLDAAAATGPVVVIGHSFGADTFLPPRRLAPAARTMLGTDLHVIPDAGHLVIEEHPGRLAALV
ncbi:MULTISPECIES: alpha/beta fold hydrolase [unclassified Streptomyces]|uniref:alpha/beta fold hydrolase n=1 Tax=unclassified Streptomyces TaxID=2593676 RepID=UPI002E2BBC85|nr:alpha/beta hydrolase [Streptomyces sp. NBC_00273]